MAMQIDLNCDMGESWYERELGQDAAVLPVISSCNLACGFHGGDTLTMERTIAGALSHGVAIGAHPSYPDRKHFGRRAMEMPIDRLRSLIQYQVAALQGMVSLQGGQLQHIKAHGALYHRAAADQATANMLALLAQDFEIPLLFGPPNSALATAASKHSLDFAAEGFIDRAYEADLCLRSRQLNGAIIEDPSRAAAQALQLARDGQVTDFYGKQHALSVQTLCLHGDHPRVVELATEVLKTLRKEGVSIQAIKKIEL